MSDQPKPGDLPGNHGQFGEGDATEEFRKLPADDGPAPAPQPRTPDGGVAPGPHQDQGGMRS
ncbi:MAG: hypothetical protein JOZ42_12210 [Acetobacteraceae bacterium]|nr:hypothetical protein [Acetobacteraceae bacterium]